MYFMQSEAILKYLRMWHKWGKCALRVKVKDVPRLCPLCNSTDKNHPPHMRENTPGRFKWSIKEAAWVQLDLKPLIRQIKRRSLHFLQSKSQNMKPTVTKPASRLGLFSQFSKQTAWKNTREAITLLSVNMGKADAFHFFFFPHIFDLEEVRKKTSRCMFPPVPKGCLILIAKQKIASSQASSRLWRRHMTWSVTHFLQLFTGWLQSGGSSAKVYF